MSAKFTPKIRDFVASSLIDSITLQQISVWTPLSPYSEGTIVYYENNKYVSKGAGTSGTNPPQHVSGTVSDGVIEWIWIESLGSNETFQKNLYIFIGKDVVWTDENSPPAAGITDLDDYDTMSNIIVLKRVNSNNFKLAIRRYNWTTGTVYSAYKDYKDPFAVSGPTSYSTPFYIFTSDSEIYKCIDNNNGAPSTIMPTSSGTEVITLADGYVWKYMATVDFAGAAFLTKDFVPVEYKKFDDSSPQWIVQSTAKKNSISSFDILAKTGTITGTAVVTIVGGTPTTPANAFVTKTVGNVINQVIVDSAGEGYDPTARIEAIVQADGVGGSGAVVGTITRDGSGTITNIAVSNAGTGYVNGAILILVDPVNTPSEAAVIAVTISPSNTISGFTYTDGGTGYSSSVRGYIIPGTAGAVAKAILAPKEGHGSNIITELCANTAVISVRLSQATSYLLTGDSNAFRQIGLITDVVEYGTSNPAFNSIYVGPSHPDYAGGSLNRIDANRGYILYLNNIKKVVRNEGQEEEVKIAISF
jgi:hypothetical protein